MFCPKCGNEIPNEAKFCPRCGNDFTQRSQKSEAPEKQKPAGKAATSKRKPPAIGIVAAAAVLVIALFCVFASAPKQVPQDPANPPESQTQASQTNASDGFDPQKYAELYESVPYDSYVAYWAKNYKHLDNAQVESVITHDVYERLLPLEFYVSYGQQSNRQVTAESETLDRKNSELAKKLEELQSAQYKPVSADTVRIDNFTCKQAVDDEGNPLEGTCNLTGTIVNDSDYSLINAAFLFRPTGTTISYDKYGEPFEPQPLSGSMQISNVSGIGCFTEGGLMLDPGGHSIYASDLRPHESRNFTCMVEVTYENISKSEEQQKDHDGDFKSNGENGADIDLKSVSYELSGAWVPISETEKLESERIGEINPTILLDPDATKYRALHDQVKIDVNSLTLNEDGGIASVNCQVTNNTGLYLDDLDFSFAVYKDKLPGDPEGERCFAHSAERSIGFLGLSSTDSTSAGHGAPGATGEFDIEMDCGDAYLTDNKGKPLPAGEYTPEELGVVCLSPVCTYTVDVDKNIRVGLLPEDWIERSSEFKRNKMLLEDFLNFVNFTGTAIGTWVAENPDQALDLFQMLTADEIVYVVNG